MFRQQVRCPTCLLLLVAVCTLQLNRKWCCWRFSVWILPTVTPPSSFWCWFIWLTSNGLKTIWFSPNLHKMSNVSFFFLIELQQWPVDYLTKSEDFWNIYECQTQLWQLFTPFVDFVTINKDTPPKTFIHLFLIYSFETYATNTQQHQRQVTSKSLKIAVVIRNFHTPWCRSRFQYHWGETRSVEADSAVWKSFWEITLPQPKWTPADSSRCGVKGQDK